MASYTVLEAQKNFPELVARAENGEAVDIVRPGKRPLRLAETSDATAVTEDDWTRAREALLSMKPIELSDATMDLTQVIRQIRDEGH